MACAQPVLIDNPNFLNRGTFNYLSPYIEVPCGWCLNCRVDRQNWLSDAMNYELRKFDFIGAFVTFTYDDNHIIQKSNIVPDDFYQFVDDDGKVHTMPFYNDRPVQYSLDRSDPKNFLKRLRSKIDYYYNKHNIKTFDLCRKDFKYFMSAEYGDCFGRPHYHFVFFGLDWNFCQDIFRECWQNGLIDSLPIKNGCFEYVTKYLLKQVHSYQAKEVYDDNNLVRPYSSHSLGLGKGLILENMDYIRSHNLCYKTINDSLRPIPIYYRRFFLSRPDPDYSKTSENMLALGVKPDLCKSNEYVSHGATIRYSLKLMNNYRRDQALLRHKKLELQCENKGIPYQPLECDSGEYLPIDVREFIQDYKPIKSNRIIKTDTFIINWRFWHDIEDGVAIDYDSLPKDYIPF